MESDDFTRRLEAALADGPTFPRKAAEDLKRYLEDFDGRRFDDYGRDPSATDRITPADLVAVTFLSMDIRRTTTSGISTAAIISMDERSDEIGRLLGQVPTHLELHRLTAEQFDEHLGDGSPSNELWDLLRNDIGLPRVATYKLFARLRPSLFPVRDRVLETVLGNQDAWWRPWWGALVASDEVVPRLEQLRQESGPPDLSLLRVADIVIWMRNHSPAASPS